MSRRKEPAIPNELLDQLLAGGAASAAFEQGGLLDSLKKALTERALKGLSETVPKNEVLTAFPRTAKALVASPECPLWLETDIRCSTGLKGRQTLPVCDLRESHRAPRRRQAPRTASSCPIPFWHPEAPLLELVLSS